MPKSILWSSALFLLSFLCINHLLVLILFAFDGGIHPFIWPTSLLATIGVQCLLLKKMRGSWVDDTIAIVLPVFIIGLSLLLSSYHFDFSWDGQWYHQAAIYSMEAGWNPVRQPIEMFNKHNDLSIVHFPKGYWYYAATVLSTFDSLEAGKSMQLIVLAVALLIVLATLTDLNFSRGKAWALSLLVCLNPVVWNQVTTYLVDSLLFFYLFIFSFALISWIHQRNQVALVVSSLAAIGLINVKFTGIVFLGVFLLFAFVYLLIWKRTYLTRFVGVNLVTLCIAIMAFGYNPYITNLIERGHILYPIIGTKEYPSVFETTGRDDNEHYETPKNIIGKNVYAALLYVTFSKPGNAPYGDVDNAELAWPFAISTSDWKAYHYHETRMAGFGPLFSGILILSFLLAIWLFFYRKSVRSLLLLFTAAILTCFAFSKHFWWPRFAPQLWVLPMIPVILAFSVPMPKRASVYTWILAGLIGINGLIVLSVHLSWETRSTITFRQQLEQLHASNTAIELDYKWFKRSIEERLNKYQIQYKKVPSKELKKGPHDTLTSVVEGYPNMILFKRVE